MDFADEQDAILCDRPEPAINGSPYINEFMKFINEKISEANIEKYGLREINIKTLKGDGGYYWTINEEKNIYLRYLGYHPHDLGEIQYSYFWKNALFDMRARSRGEGIRGGKGSTTWEYVALFPLNNEAEMALTSTRDEVYADLKQVLTAYKDFGVFSAIAEHTAYFTF